MSKCNELLNYYDKDEIKTILKDNPKLVTIDIREDIFVGRYEDLPDIIVDINDKIGSVDMEMWYYDDPFAENIITTYGFYLNKCHPEVRKDIIDRLVELQTGEKEVKTYKIMDYDILTSVIEQENQKER